MKNPLLWATAVVVALITGVLIGRQFPAHRYEKFGSTRYVLDITTGKVCEPKQKPGKPSPNLLDDPVGYSQWKSEQDGPPPCEL